MPGAKGKAVAMSEIRKCLMWVGVVTVGSMIAATATDEKSGAAAASGKSSKWAPAVKPKALSSRRMEPRGFEPLTSALQGRRSPN